MSRCVFAASTPASVIDVAVLVSQLASANATGPLAGEYQMTCGAAAATPTANATARTTMATSRAIFPFIGVLLSVQRIDVSLRGPPVDEPRLGLAEPGQQTEVLAIPVDDREGVPAPLFQPEDDLLAVGREGAGEGVLLPARELRQPGHARAVRADRHEVRRLLRSDPVRVGRQHDQPAVRRPVLFDRHFERVGRHLLEMGAVDANDEERLQLLGPLDADEGDALSVRRHGRSDVTSVPVADVRVPCETAEA